MMAEAMLQSAPTDSFWRSLALKSVLLAGAFGVCFGFWPLGPQDSRDRVVSPLEQRLVVQQGTPVSQSVVETRPVASDQDAGVTKSKLININRASAVELTQLPGIGPVIADRVVAWRTARGPFQRVEQIRSVKGIGAKRFEQIYPLITVTDDHRLSGSRPNVSSRKTTS